MGFKYDTIYHYKKIIYSIWEWNLGDGAQFNVND